MQTFAELIVARTHEPCPYLAGHSACLPLRLPTRKLTPPEFDQRMAQGDRRAGVMLYRPDCPECAACEAIRLDVGRFRPTRTQQRVKRRGDAELTFEVVDPRVDNVRIRLFNKHREGRGLGRADGSDGRIDASGYAEFLTESCCQTQEIDFRHQGKLIAVAIFDRGAMCLSAVYCCFDPDYSRFSPGVYSILTQIELCRQWGLEHLYLGYYIADSAHMSYKALYRPHQRLIEGQWRDFT